MSLPDEYSLQCEDCSLYNLTEGTIHKGKIYCPKCWIRLEEKDDE